jgi:hypothetical protein
VLDELLHFAAPFADQPDDDHVGGGVAGHHADQHRFAHAGAGEQAHPLAAPDGEQAVDGADADVQRLADGGALQRVDRARLERARVAHGERAEAVEGGRRRRQRGRGARRPSAGAWPGRRRAARLDALAGDQRRLGGLHGKTWAPGARPKTSSVGIRKIFSPWKPTTSASTELPPGMLMRQPEPRGSLRPEASMTSPLMRVRRPDIW